MKTTKVMLVGEKEQERSGWVAMVGRSGVSIAVGVGSSGCVGNRMGSAELVRVQLKPRLRVRVSLHHP